MESLGEIGGEGDIVIGEGAIVIGGEGVAFAVVPSEQVIEDAVRMEIEETLRLHMQDVDRRVQEALRLHEQEALRRMQEAERRAQEAMRQQEQEALRKTQEAERRAQEALRLREQEALRRMQEAERRAQEALRLREQEALRRMREALRSQEQAVATALRQREQHQLRATVALLDEQMQIEESIPLVEKQASSSAREEGKANGWQRANQQLEGRMRKLENAVQKALTQMFPRVDRLLARLETSSTTEGLSFRPLTSPASTSAFHAAVEVEQRERILLGILIKDAKARRAIAEATPSRLGEELHRAVRERSVEEVRRLLNEGADVNYTNSLGDTPLLSVCYHQGEWTTETTVVVELLLRNDADVNAVEINGCTALHGAAYFDNVDCVSLLLDAGANVNARGEHGETPLHLAAENGPKAAVRVLLAAGASKTLRCWSGSWRFKTPYDIATSDAVRDLLCP